MYKNTHNATLRRFVVCMAPVEHFQCHCGCWNCYWHSCHCYFVLVQNCYCLVKCSSLIPRHQVQHNCWIRVCHGANLHLQSQCRKSLETIQCSTIIKVRLTSHKYHMFVILLEYLHCLTIYTVNHCKIQYNFSSYCNATTVTNIYYYDDYCRVFTVVIWCDINTTEWNWSELLLLLLLLVWQLALLLSYYDY